MKRITTLLLAPDPADGAGLKIASKTDSDRIAELEAENESLKQELADARSGLGGIPPELRALVKEKRAAGLDLKTALESAKQQAAWDKVQKAEAEKAKAAQAKQ